MNATDYDGDGKAQEWSVEWDTTIISDGQHNVTAAFTTKTGKSRALYMFLGETQAPGSQLADISRGTWVISFCSAAVIGYGVTRKILR